MFVIASNLHHCNRCHSDCHFLLQNRLSFICVAAHIVLTTTALATSIKHICVVYHEIRRLGNICQGTQCHCHHEEAQYMSTTKTNTSCGLIKHVTFVQRISAIVIFPVGAVEGLIRLTRSTRNSRVNPIDLFVREIRKYPQMKRVKSTLMGTLDDGAAFEVNVQFAEDDTEIANTRMLLERLNQSFSRRFLTVFYSN